MGRSLRVQQREERRAAKVEQDNAPAMASLRDASSRSSPRFTRRTRQSMPAQPTASAPPKTRGRPVQKSRSISSDVSEIAPEIVVWTDRADSSPDTDRMDVDDDTKHVAETQSVAVPANEEKPDDSTSATNDLLKVNGDGPPLQDSVTSSMSIQSEQSDLSSVPSNFSSRGTTPTDPDAQRRMASDPITVVDPAREGTAPTADTTPPPESQDVSPAQAPGVTIMDEPTAEVVPTPSPEKAMEDEMQIDVPQDQPLQEQPQEKSQEAADEITPAPQPEAKEKETTPVPLVLPENDKTGTSVALSSPEPISEAEIVQDVVKSIDSTETLAPVPTDRVVKSEEPATKPNRSALNPKRRAISEEPRSSANQPPADLGTQAPEVNREPRFELRPLPSPVHAPAERSGATPTTTQSTPAVSIKQERPAILKTPAASSGKSTPDASEMRRRCTLNVRPRSSIPTDMSPYDYARECIEAAENSRLQPFTLHTEEYELLRSHISYSQVTTYLNIRNGILRQWMQNPRIAVTREEAVGCASARWVDVASVCYDWLVRAGHINFGCVEYPIMERPQSRGQGAAPMKRRTVVVIGAGMAGLGCARQLEGLFKQYEDAFHEMGEHVPKVVLLEARGRVGGRVYSRPFSTPKPPPSFSGERCTCEIGGMIITGFIGNPLNYLVRGQLGLPYHALISKTTIYDSNGESVDEAVDMRAENLYNDCLDRVSQFKFKTQPAKIIMGKKDLMEEGKDGGGSDNQKTISQTENEIAILSAIPPSEQNVQGPVRMVTVASDNVTGRVQSQPGVPASVPAAAKLKSFGWTLKDGVQESDNIDLSIPAAIPGASLGLVLEAGIEQYKKLVDLTPEDLRLINWHVANLEYSNATNINNLSLPGWDIDAGNEWSGKHTMIVGGYQRVPRGLLHCPTKLDLRTHSPVTKITYHGQDTNGPATIKCRDGYVIEADCVVSTIPLGVLKHKDVVFDPPLPEWKTASIERLGWGVLNKVILTFERAFWDTTRHIWGVLQDAPNPESTIQTEYRSRRGRYFQFLCVSATTGYPCLVALMAGDAAVDTERQTDGELAREAREVLKRIYKVMPEPRSVVVTRWGRDPFARGSYSSAGPDMQTEDYDNMARAVGNLFFAGEHTIGTHPATVHGAYMSGLRAASEVLTSMIGPLQLPTPLIRPRNGLQNNASAKRKRPEKPLDPLEAYEVEIEEHIVSRIGPRPPEPDRTQINAYRLFLHANQGLARAQYQADLRPGKRKGKAGDHDIRNIISRMWKAATPAERKPFEDRATLDKAAQQSRMEEFRAAALAWDQRAIEVRVEYEREHPFRGGGGGGGASGRGRGGGREEEQEEERERTDGLGLFKQRRKKHVNYNEDSDVDM